jgi:hypothetical protein
LITLIMPVFTLSDSNARRPSDVSEFYEQSSIGATWKCTATRNILVLLLRVNAAQQDQLYQAGARCGLTLGGQFGCSPFLVNLTPLRK